MVCRFLRKSQRSYFSIRLLLSKFKNKIKNMALSKCLTPEIKKMNKAGKVETEDVHFPEDLMRSPVARIWRFAQYTV